MANSDFIGKMVIIPPHGYQIREIVMYLASIRDGQMMFFDYCGNRRMMPEGEVELRMATKYEVAEDYLHEAGVNRPLSELPKDKAEPLVERLYADVMEMCKGKASEWEYV